MVAACKSAYATKHIWGMSFLRLSDYLLIVGRGYALPHSAFGWSSVRAPLLAFGLLTLPSAVSSQNGSVVYAYDALGRIATASYDTGVCIAYAYDANGNRTSQKILVTAAGSTGLWGCFKWNAANWGP